jgi:hypothetical protein
MRKGKKKGYRNIRMRKYKEKEKEKITLISLIYTIVSNKGVQNCQLFLQ